MSAKYFNPINYNIGDIFDTRDALYGRRCLRCGHVFYREICGNCGDSRVVIINHPDYGPIEKCYSCPTLNVAVWSCTNCGANNESKLTFGYSKKSEEIQNAGSCFIATAVYGSYDNPNVLKLRSFRDTILNNSLLGKLFIRFYYKIGPYYLID